MLVGIQDEILRFQSMGLLAPLLVDRTTKTNIIWGTDAYISQGNEYQRDKEIHSDLITGKHSDTIKTRARKAMEQQSERTRKHAEVFTPLWICKKMVSHADAVWFGKTDAFLQGEQLTEQVLFPKKRKWQHYVDARRLEITCGEAPYLVNRYDAASGEEIVLENRMGILDRKLRVVNENTADEEDWLKWALRAFQSTYGYEFQGDNLLIARVNILMTYEEYLFARWKRKPTAAEYREIEKTITWNIWQMDGLNGTIPYCKGPEEYHQLNLFEWFESGEYREEVNKQPHCRIYDWRRDNSLEFLKVNQGGRNMKFDFIIGNPPYQEETDSDSTRKPPIYNLFMDEAYKVAMAVELITPARFLFNAGYTPKAWNEKMLSDHHFKILDYEPDSSKIFVNTDIKGGVAISYWDSKKSFTPIGTFTKFVELKSILHKVEEKSIHYMDEIIASPLSYSLTNTMKEKYPELLDRLRTSAFSTLSTIFFEEMPDDKNEYIIMIGLINGKRAERYVRKDYIKDGASILGKYKVLLPKAIGSGAFGETLSAEIIAAPGIAYTQTFIAIGAFTNKQEAVGTGKYIKTKFARTMLGVLKITQDCPAPKWKYVPLQDFTPASDIDWSKSIAEIDRQLYAKYGLDEKEIAFIESHVKEMA